MDDEKNENNEEIHIQNPKNCKQFLFLILKSIAHAIFNWYADVKSSAEYIFFTKICSIFVFDRNCYCFFFWCACDIDEKKTNEKHVILKRVKILFCSQIVFLMVQKLNFYNETKTTIFFPSKHSCNMVFCPLFVLYFWNTYLSCFLHSSNFSLESILLVRMNGRLS